MADGIITACNVARSSHWFRQVTALCSMACGSGVWNHYSEKVKEVNLYSAFIVVPHTQGAQVWITQCYLQITPHLPLPRKHSPDGASPDWGCGHLIAAYYSFIYPAKGWKAESAWLADLQQTVYPHNGHPSAAGRAQDSESSPVRDRRSTTVPRNQPSEFTKWQHPAMWYVALGWHAVEFARWQHPAMWHVALGSWHWIRQVAAPCNVTGGSGMTCHGIRPNVRHCNSTSGFDFHHITAVDMPFCTSLRIFFKIGPRQQKKWRYVDFQDGGSQSSWILGVFWKANLSK